MIWWHELPEYYPGQAWAFLGLVVVGLSFWTAVEALFDRGGLNESWQVGGGIWYAVALLRIEHPDAGAVPCWKPPKQ
ncbi:hypothetical protein B0T14DRAFT_523680 [Immersiella caudata]|uniref:Uncharacterized protein n=1 Tax=Immersiella caudata TaxID=314043 RepID=A0AA40BWX9_9PEZI|nr:hypothetical protein B0T14DRAFT_523680 [Immersiella caudata]